MPNKQVIVKTSYPVAESQQVVGESLTRERQQEVVANLGLLALRGIDLRSLMEECVNQVAETLGVGLCKILQLLPDENLLLLVAGVGWKEGMVGVATESAGRESQAGYALMSKEPVVVLDLKEERRFSAPPLLLEHGAVSGISVVVHGLDRPFGVLGVHALERRDFTIDDVHFMQNVAYILASAIERENAEKTQRLLSQAGELLTSSLDYRKALASLARLVVPALGDWCSIDMVDDKLGRIKNLVVSHVDPDKVALAEMLQRRYPPEPDALKGIPHVLRTGKPERYEEITGEMLARIAQDKEHLEILKKLDMRSAIIVPLKAHRRTLGAITLVRAGKGRRYRLEDVRLVEEIASRAAMAIDNARLYRESQALNAELELRVAERTAQLKSMVAMLHKEIAERYRAEEAMKASETMMHALFEASPDAQVIVDQQGSVVKVNAQTESLFGYDRRELEGKPVEILLPESFRNVHMLHRADYYQDPVLRPMAAGLELYGRRKDGSVFPVEIMLSPVRTDQGLLVMSAVRDISERKKAEEALRQSETRFRHIFNEAAIGVSIMDLKGRWLDSNPAVHKMLGYTADELRQMTFVDVSIPEQAKEDLRLLEELLAGKRESYKLDKLYRCKDGSLAWGYLTVSLVRDSEGKPDFVIALVEDVTERKQMQADLEEMSHSLHESAEKERLRLAQELHDGPIQDLHGAIYQLQSKNHEKFDQPLNAHLHEVRITLQSVINDLRSMCRELRPPTLIPFGLARAIVSHAGIFQEENPDLTVHLELMEDGQQLSEGVRLALFRIYQQALNNVAKHAQANTLWVRFTLDAEQAILEVQDDGRGFQLPERWIEMAREGHLGLVGAFERADAVGGKLEVISAPGEGTLLRVVIPL